MADVILTEEEFARVQALAEASDGVQRHIARLLGLSRPFNRHDITAEAFGNLYAARQAVKTIQPKSVKNANPPRTRSTAK